MRRKCHTCHKVVTLVDIADVPYFPLHDGATDAERCTASLAPCFPLLVERFKRALKKDPKELLEYTIELLRWYGYAMGHLPPDQRDIAMKVKREFMSQLRLGNVSAKQFQRWLGTE
jgi:hypothetical protein